jgi:Ca2+-binding RTX toxin-like protein
MAIRRTVHKSTFRKIFALSCTLFLTAVVLVSNRPASAGVLITPTTNFQVDINAAEAVSVDCSGGFVRVTVDAVPNVTATPCNAVTSLRVTAIGAFDNTINLSGVTTASFTVLTSTDVDGGPGNDTITGSEIGDQLRGGLGNDTILGGPGIDLGFGGEGNDVLIGGGGNDQLHGEDGNDIFGNPSAVANGVADDTGNDQFFGGSGSDKFFWEPGDGDDLVEGGAGDSDQIQFFGNAGAEQFFVFADVNVQSRLHIFRVQASIDIDASDIEEVNLRSGGGGDIVRVGRSDTGTLSDLSTTGVRLVFVFLDDDAATDSIVVEGRPVDDNILVTLPVAGNFDSVRVAGLGYDVIFNGLDSPASDTLTVNGNEGNDAIKAVDGVQTAVNITLNGGAGNDVLSADAILNGSDGNDTLEGGSGNNTMDGGAGDDVFIGNGGTDNIGGGGGSSVGDALLLPGTSGNDTFDLAMDPGGHLLATVNGVTTTYQGFLGGPIAGSGIELISVQGQAGNDALTVNSATGAVPIPVNFAGGPNVDSLNLTGGAATSNSYTAGPLVDQGISQVVIGGVTQTVSFSSIEPMTDLIAGPFTVNGNNANNAINYTQGSIAANGLVSVDNFETAEFSNKTTLTINGLSGDDVINLNNSATPTGLTGITVNGNDPTASDTLIVNGTSVNDAIAFNPSATIGAGGVTINATPAVVFATIESVVIDGRGGTDGLTHNTPGGTDQVTYTPGAASDIGTIATRGAGVGTTRVPMTFLHIGAGGSVTFASAGGREDIFELYGTDDSDVFNVNSPVDTVQVLDPTSGFVTVRLNTGGMGIAQFRGLNGDDVFNLAAVLPYFGGTLVDGGDPSASDVLNLTGAAGPIAPNVANQSVTGYGGTVSYLGVERVRLGGSGGAATLVVNGTTADDTINFSPTSSSAGSFAIGGNSAAFSYSGVAGGVFVHGGTGFDTLGVLGTATADVVTSTATTVTINGAAVTLVTGLERLEISTFGGSDDVNLTTAPTIQVGIFGGEDPDALTGSPNVDLMEGGPGNDFISGLAGNDTLRGGDGNDRLIGGAGTDFLFGDADSDAFTWVPGDGSDFVEGGTGADELTFTGSAGAENFTIAGFAGRTILLRDVGGIQIDIGDTERVQVDGLAGDDVFDVGPAVVSEISVNGGDPPSPAVPGDRLNLNFTGANNPTQQVISANSGAWNFSNRQSVRYSQMETLTPQLPAISVFPVAITEGNSGSTNAVFLAAISNTRPEAVSFDVVTSNGTATSGSDYQPVNTTLVFAPGVQNITFNVPINGDTTPEGNETFFVNVSNAINATINTTQATGTINDDDATSIFQFSAATANVNENAVPGSATVTVTRTGDLAGAASVKFETNDGTGKQKTDYTFGYGTVQFGPGEVSRDVKILIVNDVFVEGAESFQVSLSNPSGNCAVGSPNPIVVTITDDDIGPAANPIDEVGFFVRQQYLDFLGREPDAPGLAFWTANITSCGVNPACIEVRRIDTSAAFFFSIEFQETSGFVLRTQRVSFGRQSDDQFTRVPYLQFMRDTRQVGAGVIVGEPGFAALLEQNKQIYAEQLVISAEFVNRFPPAPGPVYVDALFASAGATPTAAERTAAINAFGAGGTTGRIAAMRSVADSSSVRAVDSNPAFVLSEYYGYLRRNPTDAPDFNDAGYQFWLTKLNLFNGNYQTAEMVKAFLASSEYRGRFGTP